MSYLTIILGYLYLVWAYLLWRGGAPGRIIFLVVFCAVSMFIVAALEAAGIKVP